MHLRLEAKCRSIKASLQNIQHDSSLKPSVAFIFGIGPPHRRIGTNQSISQSKC
uniref:Uncharacterized protein n=1 Tax=Rhizophora mucronata TaxID=61149 RepID=A0A2P2N8X6_RHIMU